MASVLERDKEAYNNINIIMGTRSLNCFLLDCGGHQFPPTPSKWDQSPMGSLKLKGYESHADTKSYILSTVFSIFKQVFQKAL